MCLTASNWSCLAEETLRTPKAYRCRRLNNLYPVPHRRSIATYEPTS